VAALRCLAIDADGDHPTFPAGVERKFSAVLVSKAKARWKTWLLSCGIVKNSDLYRVDGRLSWGELAQQLPSAEIYVEPDTSMPHLAADADVRPWSVSSHGIGSWPNAWVVQIRCRTCCERNLEGRSVCLVV